MKIIFFGTPEYVLPILESIHKKFVTGPGKSPIVAVVTQKPRPSGRKQILTYTPIDKWAHLHKIPIYYDFLEPLPEADLGIVASYGNLIPEHIIKGFSKGVLVVHPSLLPEFRWASPVPATIVTGTNPTGVSIIKMDDKFDHGPIVTSSREDVTSTDTTETLRNRLFLKSAEILVELIEPYLKAKVTPKTQDEKKATFARQILKEEAFIAPEYLEKAMSGKPSKEKWIVPFIQVRSKRGGLVEYTQAPTPENIDRFVRAMQTWPGAWTLVKLTKDSKLKTQKRLKILKAHIDTSVLSHKSLVLDMVQLEGKNPVTWKEFKLAHPKVEFVS